MLFPKATLSNISSPLYHNQPLRQGTRLTDMIRLKTRTTKRNVRYLPLGHWETTRARSLPTWLRWVSHQREIWMWVSQSRTVALDTITVLETQPYLQPHLGRAYLEPGGDDMEGLARGIIMGEVL